MTNGNGKVRDVYRCPHCRGLNEAVRNDWCLCTGGDQTLVCGRCHRCFCDAPTAWKLEFWTVASDALSARRREERMARDAFAPDGRDVVRPVILVIDDDRLVHAIVERVLADFQGTVLHALDGRTGLQVAQRVHPEVVVTDALLPGLDGRELARTLKSDAGTAHVKVVIMTALYKGARYRNEALSEFRADEFIEKPVSAARLRTVISALVDWPGAVAVA